MKREDIDKELEPIKFFMSEGVSFRETINIFIEMERDKISLIKGIMNHFKNEIKK